MRTRTHTMRTIAALIALTGLTAACSQPADDALPPLDDTSKTTTDPSSTTESTASTTTTDPEPQSDLADLETLWTSLIATTEPATESERQTAVTELGPAIDPEVGATMAQILGAGDYPTPTRSTTNTVFVKRLNQRIEIEDCVYYEPGVLGSFAHRYTGVADPDGVGGWIIIGIERQQDDCIPGPTAQTIYNAYDAYVEASNEYWGDPPNPNHPGIDQTLTGEFRDFIRERLTEALEDGWYVRDEDTIHPEITKLILPTRVEITDCREMDPKSGLYEQQQGDRRPGSEPAEPGERLRFDVVMTMEGGTWKIEDILIHLESDCETAPTHLATAVVG